MHRLLLLLPLAAASLETTKPAIPTTLDEYRVWQHDLSRVRALRSRDQHELSLIVRPSGMRSGEPSFSRLFTHDTWSYWANTSPLRRFSRAFWMWQDSTILQAVFPCVLIAAAWAAVVCLLGARFTFFTRLAASSPLSAELQGTAIGLLLVFRTNNGYERLSEARMLLGRVLVICRDVAQSAISTWPPLPAQRPAADADAGADDRVPCAAALRLARYIVALAWSLKAMVREPVRSEQLQSPEDVLRVLLPAGEVDALMAQPLAIPVALLGQMRNLLAAEQRAGRLQSHVHLKLEEDLRDLNSAIGDNQRLFHSPIPPTMSRHVTRCLLLWLLALPLALIGRLSDLGVVLTTASTTFIFVGMEEIGAQVEQVRMTRARATS